MTSESEPIQRQVTLRDLEGFLRSLAAVLLESGIPADKLRDAFIQALTGECKQCGQGVGGEELYLLARKETDKPGARVLRLRRGYCAREGCASNFYLLTFAPYADLDWPKLLGRAEHEIVSPPQEEVETQAQAVMFPQNDTRRRLAIRAGIILLALVALFIFRQWYRGGTIPFLREPEHFKVDVIDQEPGMPPH